MKVWKFLAAPVLLAAMLTACSDEESPKGSGSNGGGNKPVVAVEGMNQAILTGLVTDTDGNPIAGVSVTSGSQYVTTDNHGMFKLEYVNVKNKRTVVSFSRGGYVDVVRSAYFDASDIWNVVMTSKSGANCHNHTFAASQGATLSANGMQVELQKDGFVLAEDNTPYTGNVTAEMTYLSPNDPQFAGQMPGGDLAAIRADGSDAQLVSYGMVCINMYDVWGRKLQLKEGCEATVKFPVPDGMEAKPTIPLWSFNEETGLWEEEGVATLDNSNNCYVGAVKHFSWANLDSPEIRGTLTVKVVDPDNNPLPNVFVVVGQVLGHTRQNGSFSTFVPINETFDVFVDLTIYGGTQMISEKVSITNPLSKGEKRTITVKAPKLRHVKGKIVNSKGGSTIATLTLKYTDNGVEKQSIICGNQSDGSFDLIAPINYNGPATLHIEALEGVIIDKDITFVAGKDVNVGNIDIKAKTEENRLVVVVDGKEQSFPIMISSVGGMTKKGDSYSFNSQRYENTNTAMSMSLDNYKKANESFYINFDIRPSDDEFIMINCCTDQQLWHNGNPTKLKDPEYSLTLNGDYYELTVSGQAVWRNEGHWEEGAELEREKLVTIKKSTFRIPKNLEIEVLRNVDPTKCGLPDFAPKTTEKAKVVELHKLRGKDVGGIIYTNGDKDEYDKLAKQIDNSGKLVLTSNSSDYGYENRLYEKDKNSLELRWNPYGNDITDDATYYEYCKITICCFKDGYTGENDRY